MKQGQIGAFQDKEFGECQFQCLYQKKQINNAKIIINKAKKVLPLAYLLKPFDEVQLKVTIDLAMLNYKKEVEGIEEVARYSEQIEELTKREKQVLIVLASGKTAKETGDNLNISAHTVEVHKKNIKKKLHMNTMSELINFALSSKLYEVS